MNNVFPDIQIKSLENLADREEEKAKTLSGLSGYVAKGWVFHVQDAFRRNASVIAVIEHEKPETHGLLDQIKSIAMETTRTMLRRYPAYLDEACAAAGLPIDRESRHPKYTIDKGFFQLVIDEGAGMARLSDYEGQLDELPADVEAVVQVLQREHSRVFGRKRDDKRFLAKLRRQYLAVIQKAGLADGESVPIRQLTRRLGKNEKGFRTDEFLVDLSRLVEAGQVGIEGRRLDLQQTKDTHQGMLLHGPAGRAYIGFIAFRKE